MLRIAELLADLTLLKTINSSEALALVSATSSDTEANDPNFSRAMEFLALRATSGGKAHEELAEKRKAVRKVLRRVTGTRTPEEEKDEQGEEGDASSMAGAWGR